jgi:hypothetical protein
MDLSRGCVLLARSLDESDIFQNEKWLKVFIWCLIQANHKGKNVPVNIGRAKTSVWVDRGQFIFGRNKAAEKLGMSPSTVRNIMQKLVDFNNLDMQKDTHFSIVTVCDYDFYQTFENYKGQAKGQPMDSQRTADGQPEDTTKTPKTPISPKTPKEIITKPENVTDQTWSDWLSHRKEKKAKVTETVLKGFIKQAELAGLSLEETIKESINRNWIGFKADWYLKDKQGRRESVTEHNAKFFDRLEDEYRQTGYQEPPGSPVYQLPDKT